MRVVVQRVKKAKVEVDNEVVGVIEQGLLVFLGVHLDDRPEETQWLVNKLINLRCFQDKDGKMNLNLKDIEGQALIISQFTLYANCTRGRRPDFIQTAPPETAEKIYDKFVAEVKQELGSVQTGQFGAYMHVSLINDGPVTFVIDSKKE